VDRCALFVDAGYVLADGAMAVHGTRQRDSVSWDYAGLVKLLTGLSRDRTGLPVLRCYWYEATVEGRRSYEHDSLADLSGVKLRLGRMRPGRREGVEAEMHRDLTTLARNRAVSEAVIVSADEDLAEVVAELQDFGLRVIIVHITADGNWTVPRPLRQECDDIVEISGAHLRPFVDLIAGAEPADHDDRYRNGSYESAGYERRNVANGNGAGLAAVTYRGLPAAALPAPPAIYATPVVEQYQRTAQPLGLGPPSPGPLTASALAAAAAAAPPPATGHNPTGSGRVGDSQNPAAPEPSTAAPEPAEPLSPAPFQDPPFQDRAFQDPATLPRQAASPSPGADLSPAQARQPAATSRVPPATQPSAMGTAQGPASQPLAAPAPAADHGTQPGERVQVQGGYGYQQGNSGEAREVGQNVGRRDSPVRQLPVAEGLVQQTPDPQAPVQQAPTQPPPPQFPAGQPQPPQPQQPQFPAGQPQPPQPQQPQFPAGQPQPPQPQQPQFPAGQPQPPQPQQRRFPAGQPSPSNQSVPQQPAQRLSAQALTPAAPAPASGPAEAQFTPAKGDYRSPEQAGQHAGLSRRDGMGVLGPDVSRSAGSRNQFTDAEASDGIGKGPGPARLSEGSPPAQFGAGPGSGRFAEGAGAGRFSDGPAPGRFAGGAGAGRFSDGPAPGRFSDGPAPGRFAGGAGAGRFSDGPAPGRFAEGAGAGRFSDGPAPGPFAEDSASAPGRYQPAPPGAFGHGSAAHVSYPQFPAAAPGQHATPVPEPGYSAQQNDQGPYSGPQSAAQGALSQPLPEPTAISLTDAVQAAHAEGFGFGDAVARDAPALWLEAVLARKPRMPSDLEARLLQGSALPIDSLLHDEVRHSLRRGFWDALERSRR